VVSKRSRLCGAGTPNARRDRDDEPAEDQHSVDGVAVAGACSRTVGVNERTRAESEDVNGHDPLIEVAEGVIVRPMLTLDRKSVV